MTSYQATATLLTGALRSLATDVNIHPAFRAGLPTSPALDRAIAAMEAKGAEMRAGRVYRTKLGAEIILNDWRRLADALNGPYAGPTSRRQAKIAMRWRRRFGTLVSPPTHRSEAQQRAAMNPLTGGL